MKKLWFLMLLVFTTFVLASCGNPNTKTSSTLSTTPTTTTPGSTTTTVAPTGPSLEESVGFVIHYQRDDGDYDPWCLWLWEDGKDGAIYDFNGEDEYGAYYMADFSVFSPTLRNSKLGFIVRMDSGWTKDYDQDRFLVFSTYTPDENGYIHIYLKTKDGTIYTNAGGEVMDVISSFDIQYNNAEKMYILAFKTNKTIGSYKIYIDNEVYVDSTHENDLVYLQTDTQVKCILGSDIPDLTKKISLDVTFKASGKTLSKNCNISTVYRTKPFEEAYTYDGDLGAIYTSEETTFRVWSPVSKSIKLRIYETGTPLSINVGGKDIALEGGSNTYTEYNMTQGVKGTWEYTLKGDYDGQYYTYVVTNGNYTDFEVVDPYAKSTGINGLRGMVVDFSKTNPEGWDLVKLNGKTNSELVVYETHVADLTSSSTWNGTKENSKTFVGFYEEGTTYEGVTTGFDHVKELGVNAVQLIPIFDAYNDERLETRIFNWGYNPLNYNSLDGIFSKNPYDGYEKIKEFKNLVKAYSDNGINIIMDVVYNHVNGLDKSNFDVLMPNYYYRYLSGSPSNGSGCGNETASEMPMFRKFMIDSTEFWASEYKLGGFRFDLMGLHDTETMNLLAENIHTNVSEDITIYGEPWAGGTAAYPSNKLAMQANMADYKGYGCFNDQMRDALIKGGLSGPAEKGWITNNTSKSTAEIAKITSGISGKVLTYSTKYEVEKCVNYVTCHDNYTLYDRVVASGTTDEETIKNMARLAQSVVLTSQGVKFILAGEEFLRTKGGNHNSYDASYEVNELDYSLKVKHMDLFETYKALIRLNNETNLFMKNNEECQAIEFTVSSDSNLIMYKLTDTLTGKEYVIIHCNGYAGNTSNIVNLEGYTLYLDTLNSKNLVLSSETVIESYQTIIAYK